MRIRSGALCLVVAALAGATSACGGAEDPAAQASSPAPAARTTIYFLTDGGSAPIGVRRAIRKDSPPAEGATLRGALEALLAGPSARERAAGITSAIPDGTELRAVTFRGFGGTGAVVELSDLSAVDDPLDRARVITQVVRTVVRSGDTERVWLRSNGRPWGLWTMDGGVRGGPFDYGTLHGFWLGAGCAATETVVCDSFRALP